MSRLLAALASLMLVGACGADAASPAESPPPSTFPSAQATDAPSPTGPPEPLRLLILGDSIAIPKLGCGSCEGFDQQYAAFLEDSTGRPVEVTNRAKPGARIRNLRSVLDTDTAVHRQVADADIIVVSIGYNNLPPWGPDLACPAPTIEKDADIWQAILAMTPTCIDASMAILSPELDAIYGRIEELAGGRAQVRINLGVFNNLRDNPGGDGTIGDVSPEDLAAAATIYASAIDTWNTADCTAATSHGFVCGDLHHAFNGPDGEGSIMALVNPADFVHPNVAGQAVIADLLESIDLSVLGRG